jgi:FMN reductase
MQVLVLSCSLNPGSRSARLADRALQVLQTLDDPQPVEASLLDLRTIDLPACDGGACYGSPAVRRLAGAVEQADAVLLASPVYNYDLSAAAKATVELASRAWTGKVVGFMCTAGGRGSYMSTMGMANSLMLDFRCLIVPRFVYALEQDIDGDSLSDTVDARVTQLCEQTVRLAAAWRQVQQPEPATA